MADFLRRCPRLRGPPGMTVDSAFGMDGRRRAKLDQLDHFFLQRPRLTHGRAQCLHGVQVLRVLLLEVSVGVVLFLLCHLFSPREPAPACTDGSVPGSVQPDS